MDEFKNIILTASISLIIGELIYYITPKDKLIDNIYALIYTVIIVTAVFSFTGFNIQIDDYLGDNKYQDEIDNQISQYYAFETEKELKKMIIEVLDTVHIKVEDIITKIAYQDQKINIHSITIYLKDKSDLSNAKIIVEKVFGNEINMEILTYE